MGMNSRITPVYLDMFDSKNSVEEDFEIQIPDTDEILLASYGSWSYDGDAFVLFRRHIKGEKTRLFEVNGSHCSCYGLEGQWEPEETTIQALRFRMKNGRFGQDEYHKFANELTKILDALE